MVDARRRQVEHDSIPTSRDRNVTAVSLSVDALSYLEREIPLSMF